MTHFQRLKIHRRISPAASNSRFFPGNEKIEERAEDVEEENHDYPDDFFGAIQRFRSDGVDEHPDPEDRGDETDEGEKHRLIFFQGLSVF